MTDHNADPDDGPIGFGESNSGVIDGVPDDNTTLTDVLAAYASAGYTASFGVVADAIVHCFTCDVESPATTVETSSMRRLEGASDPDDMMAIAAIVCPACQARGVLILGYGPASDSADSDVLRGLDESRQCGPLPPHSAPGEAAGDTCE